MENDIKNLNNFLSGMINQSKQLNNEIVSMNHKDFGVNNYINKIKRLSAQNIDLINEMQRQIGFLYNEYRGCRIRESIRKSNGEKTKQDQRNKRR